MLILALLACATGCGIHLQLQYEDFSFSEGVGAAAVMLGVFFGAGCAALLSLILSTISLFKEKCRIWSGAMVIISLGILITLLVWFNEY